MSYITKITFLKKIRWKTYIQYIYIHKSTNNENMN